MTPVALLLASLLPLACARPEKRPNVILVTIESLRADHVGCYGYERPTTPNLDRFASGAAVYDEAYSITSWTLPSHASLLTGLYPSELQVTEPHHSLDDSYRTLAERLADEGYTCVAFTSGPFLRKPYNLNQGFSFYDDSPSALSQENAHGDITNPVMEEKVTAFLRSMPAQPFFLFAYFWDVHYDYNPPAPYDTLFVTDEMEPFDISRFEMNDQIAPGIRTPRLAYIVSQYDGEIRCTDEMFGRIFEAVREEGLWDETAILVTSDHGEEFFDHGNKGHKHSLHRESVHVPLIIKPAGVAEARRDDRLASLLDVAPTILEMCGIGRPDSMRGRSLLRPPEGDHPELFHELMLTYYGFVIGGGFVGPKTFPSFALRDGDFKYMALPRKGGERLYHVSEDPFERHDLSDSLSADLPRWREKIRAWKKDLAATAAGHGTASTPALSREERERLEALGYLQAAPRSPPGAR